MKKFLTLIHILILILILGGLAFFYTRNHADQGPAQSGDQNSAFVPDPSNATFSFDDGAVTLSSGRGENQAEGEASAETVELLDERATGDLNKDGKNDTAVLLARSGGGSGVFIYIGAFVSGPVSYKGTNTLFIGDRISPESITIKDGVVVLRWLDRKPDEPFVAEPTVEKEEHFVYSGGTLEKQ